MLVLLGCAANAEEIITRHTITKYIETSFYYQEGPFIKPIAGALDWKLFEETRMDGDTLTFGHLNKYQNKPVMLYGYMFAVTQKGTLKRFIIGPYPNACPFHYHVKKNVIVEVDAVMPIAFTLAPILLKGTLTLAKHSDGYFYQLNDALLAQ